MKSSSSILMSLTLCRRIPALAGAVVIGVGLLSGTPSPGVTVVSKAANAEIRLDVPYLGETEFENPLTGAEIVAGHHVLEWRDADYAAGPPPWYDDWSVNIPANIDGWPDQVWLRNAGDAAWTTTTVPSTIISIHMNGDNNDGLAQVLVDGAEVAQLDMYYAGAGVTWRQTVLIIVRGLANTTHTVRVNDLGFGPSGMGDDVQMNGAAALRENPIKWNQPPQLTEVTKTFYYGWNQMSVAGQQWNIAADDWVCNSTNPVTKIRWWGSFIGWASNAPPPVAPSSFQIQFWTDVPAGIDAPYSHPGAIEWQINCQTFTWQFVGYDYDPTTTNIEACFLFEQTLLPTEYFRQLTPVGTIHWLSIGAVYQIGTAGPFPWGWKTRQRDPASLAPDAAVITSTTMPPGWAPIFWPDPTNWWDLAFELISTATEHSVKWEQVPDLSTNGMDVNATFNPAAPPAFLLADDFQCTSMEPITNITIWGSWTNDADWFNTTFTLSIHDDIPTNISPTGYSMPGPTKWQMTFYPGQYAYSLYAGNINEWWFTPTNRWRFPGDHQCFQYDFNIPPLGAFWQEGTPATPKVYWLDVQAQVLGAEPFILFGWKTCPTNWNDDAVWANGTEPWPGPWNKLTYPPPHVRHGQTVDMAFRLNAGTRETTEIKWSQPPIVATDIPWPFYRGWNEVSWYGGEYGHPIVADDWVCTTTNPVTDIHFWGSFTNWNNSTPPYHVPDVFFISFWTDVPADPANPQSFSHPDMCQQVVASANYSFEFVGWDWDPRNLDAGPEACYKFHVDLPTNEWFYQNPAAGTNIYWISIAAWYTNSQLAEYPWGWKSRPRDPASPAPDDAVLIWDPTAPLPGSMYLAGEPIWWPDWASSWDMAFQLTTLYPDELDFSDAPDPTYRTLLASNGARHYIVPGFNLGAIVDAETNGLPNANATGDDANNLADEDGVTFQNPLLVGTQAWVNVVLTSLAGTGQLDTWVDFDQSGTWDAGEKVFNNLTLVSGLNALSLSIPTNAAVGPTFARFRLSSAGGLLPSGAAADGEVEDYQVVLRQYAPSTNIVITNIVLTSSSATIYWTAETNVHYWLLATTNLGIGMTNWTRIGAEVIGPANSQVETNRWPANRFYRVIAPYLWP